MLRVLILALAIFASTPAFAQNVNYLPPSTAAEATHVFCSGPCQVAGFSVNTGGASGWVMVVDGTAAPADGSVSSCAVNPNPPCIAKWYQIAANSTIGVSWIPLTLRINTGFVLVCSSTGPFTKTATATCEFGADVR